MNRTVERAGRAQRRAGFTIAWLWLTCIATFISALFGAPTAGATGIDEGPAPTQNGLPGVAVTLSTTAAEATDVTYLVEFTMPRAARDGVWVEIRTAGSTLPTCGHITDLLTSDSSDACAAGTARPSNAMTINTGSVTIGRGDAVAVEFDGVANGVTKNGVTKGLPGAFSLSVWVSTSRAGLASGLVGTGKYQFSKMSSLTGLSATLSSYAVGATEVTYGIKFQTSETGGLAPDGTITVKAGNDIVLPTCGHVTDLSTGANSDACAAGSVRPSDQMTISMGGQTAIGPGDAVWVEFNGVSDKGEVWNGVGGATKTVEVWTSSDARAIATYQLMPVHAVSDVYVQLSSRVAGAKDVTYAVTFQTSATGGLAQDGTITVAGEGLVSQLPQLPTCGQVTDLSTGASSNACAQSGAVPSYKMTISTGSIAIGAGDEVEVVFTGVTNRSAGSHRLTVSSSSDGPGTTTFDLEA
jgi:hypothetical protein